MPVDQISLYRFIGRRLQAQRTSLTITQSELAERAKLSRTSIANIEAGNQNAPLHVLYELCQILGLKPSELLPSLEEITSATEVADSIAKAMSNAGNEKAANLVRDISRSAGRKA